MVDKGSVVRDSKFRHLFGKPWKKDLCFTDARLQTSCNQSNSIRANGEYFAFPWNTAGGGSIVVVPLVMQGPKIPAKYPILNAHSSPVTDFQFHPFESLLVTGSRESSVKLWSLPKHQGEQSIPDLPTACGTLDGHTGRISTLRFHPCANNVLSSGSSDKTVKVWDVEAQQEIFSFQPSQIEQTTDMAWNLDGSLLACSFQKEKKVRVMDPRAPGTAFEFTAHSGAKGTFLCFMENNRLLTVGSSKSVGGKSGRDLSIWDLSGDVYTSVASKPVASNNFSAVMVPYYDSATGMAYLTGRGNAIFFYEINNSGEMIFPVGQSNTSISYTGACPVPKRVCDVRQCEIERFYVASADTIAVTSILCPRKSSQTVFQEDLYPAVPGTQPALVLQKWVEGENARPLMISMKPKDLKSVFELSKEEGGKSKGEEIKRMRSRTSSRALMDQKVMAKLHKLAITEGEVKVFTNGWIRKWGSRWLEIGKDFLYVYEAKDSPNLTLCIALDSIKSIEISHAYDITKDNLFAIESDSLSEKEHFYCTTTALCRTWMKAIQNAMLRSSESSSPVDALFVEPDTNDDVDRRTIISSSDIILQEGWLEIYLLGYVYNGWAWRWFVLTKEHLRLYKNNKTKTNNPLETLHVPKMITVSKSDEAHPNRSKTFKLCTATRVLHLASKEESEVIAWMNVLTSLIHPDNPLFNKKLLVEGSNEGEGEGEGQQDHNQDTVIEGFVMKKNSGMLGLAKPWTRYFLTVAAGRDFLYFNTQRDTTTRLRISMQTVTNICESVSFPDVGFEVHTADNRIHQHQALDIEDRNRWIKALCLMRNQFINYFEHLQIDPERINSEARVKDADIKNFIDPITVKNGLCPLMVKIVGKRRIRTRLVPLSSKYLNDTSVVVVDAGNVLYQWSGKKAPRVVKAKGWDITNKIRTKERGGLAKVINLDQGKDSNNEFWSLLGGKPAPKKTSEEALAKMRQVQEDEDKNGDPIRIYRIYNQETPLASRIKLIHEGTRTPPKEFLIFDSVSIVDCENEIYIWVGKEASTYQRKLGLVVALKLQQQATRPPYTIISRVFDKGETILFKEKFSNYPGMLPINVSKQSKKSAVASSQEQAAIDVDTMHHAPKPTYNFYDDPKVSGKIIKVWKIEGFDKKEVPESLFGSLWSHDSFVILYRFPYQNKEKNLVYYWQGKCSTRNEKGTSAYVTVDISDEIGHDVQQIRVEQDKEEEHFLHVMKKYNYTIFLGKYDEAVTALHPRLFTIRGQKELVHSTEVPVACTELHTCHCSVLVTESQAFLWKGMHASPMEVECATRLASSFTIPVIEGMEGKSDVGKSFTSFWKALGGKGTYYGYDGSIAKRMPIRLFTCSNVTGSVVIEEVVPFSQESTVHYEHILILDLFYELYVWIGKASVNLEKKLAMEAAIEYVTASPFGHSPDTPIWVIYPFAEPLSFTANFPTWSKQKYPPKQRNHSPSQLPVMDVLQDYLPKIYSYEELLQDPLPPGIDSTKLEQYLSDEEFEKIFSLPREEFMKIPAWKAERLKQDFGLY